MPKKLILGSSSPYREALLRRLKIPFSTISPSIDERPQTNESANDLVKRLAFEKADAIANQIKSSEEHLIIGSDQVALLDNSILGKPGDLENAYKQLSLFSNKKVEFLTSLCVLNNQSNKFTLSINSFYVYFRKLSEKEIMTYLKKEEPFDCAGSFKSEGLGVALFDKMEGTDPNTLIGLPLIDLCNALREMGLDPLN